MSLRIRQIVLCAADLDAATDAITAITGAPVAYRDPNVAHFGLKNALFVFGDQFLEVVSPMTENSAGARHLARHGDSAYMLILQTDDFASDRARMDQVGARTVWTSEHPDIEAFHIHPRDIGAAIVSIDQPRVAADWPWCGERWRDHAGASGVTGVNSVTVGALKPTLMADRWAQVLDLPELKDAGAPILGLEGGKVLFEENPADLITGFGLVADDPDAVIDAARAHGVATDTTAFTLCGCRFDVTKPDAG